MAIAALVVAILSLATSIAAIWYSRIAAKASQDLATVEQERHRREIASSQSARLLMIESSDFVQIRNIGEHTARDVRLTYEGLRFQTLTEDDEAGLEIEPGGVLELMPLVDWQHPRNRDQADHRRHDGRMGVPSFPLTLSWTDGSGQHVERRRVERQRRATKEDS